jgi:hypothetical protein
VPFQSSSLSLLPVSPYLVSENLKYWIASHEQMDN